MSVAGTNFVSEKSWEFCRYLNIHEVVSSSYSHQSHGQAETWIKFIKCTMMKTFDINNDIYLALLQIQSTPVVPGLPDLSVMLFNRPVIDLMPK